MDHVVKKDCFAYRNMEGHEGCKALTDLFCKKEECRFYKPSSKVDNSAIERAVRNYSTK